MKKFSNLTYRCIKTESIDDVVPRSLKDVGFPVDTDVKTPDYIRDNLPPFFDAPFDITPYSIKDNLE